jgi:DNA-binding GntR family transcriptional regulator
MLKEDNGDWENSNITPIGPDRTVEQMLVRELRTLIITGQLAPGTSLPYRAIARKFNVSVTPVRIAIRELAKEGLVEGRPHGGVRVASLSLEELEEVYATRIGLESWLARIGATQLTAEDMQVMDEQFPAVEHAVDVGNREAFVAAAWEYRCTCYRAADRPRLVELVDLLAKRSARYNRLAIFPEERLRGSFALTVEFREACRERDGQRAQEAIRDLLDRSLDYLVQSWTEFAASASGRVT